MNREKRVLKLIQNLNPIFVDLKNESHKHASHHEHLGSAAQTGETHYKLTLVSDVFTNLPRIDRQRKLNDLLKEEFQTGLHAFEMKIYTVDEYEKIKNKV